jgi:hypothetical protein
MLAGIGIILIIKQLPYAFGVGETANFTDYIPFVNDWEAVKALWKLGDKFRMGGFDHLFDFYLHLDLVGKTLDQKNSNFQS